MKARHIALALSFALLASALARPSHKSTRDPGWPPAFATCSSVTPGATTITVGFGGANTTDEDVTISATPGVFSVLPKHVTVPAYQNYVTFSATISSSATGSFTVSAENDLGSVSSESYTLLPPTR